MDQGRWGLIVVYAVSVLPSFALISLEKRQPVALLQLYFCCYVAVSALYQFLVLPWVGLRSMIMAFLGHTHMHICNVSKDEKIRKRYNKVPHLT